MSAALLLTFREGLEAAVILSILLAFLKRAGEQDLARYVLYAALAAAAMSVAAGVVVFETTGELEGRAEQLFEGTVMIVAAIVITHVWRHSRNVRRQYENQTAVALASTSARRAIFVTAFVVVLIEGLEVVLFLRATVGDSAGDAFVGGLIGLALAVAVGLVVYQANRLRDAILLFYLVGAALIVLAAGLLAHGVHEFQEAGIIPVLRENLWNTNGILDEGEGFGKFMRSLFGYNGNPELLEVIVWVSYLTVAAWYFQAVRFLRTLIPNARKSMTR